MIPIMIFINFVIGKFSGILSDILYKILFGIISDILFGIFFWYSI